MTSTEIGLMLFDRVFSKHGVPRTIILDGDKLLMSHSFKENTRMLNIELNMASKGHPHTDGYSKNMIGTLSAMIRTTAQKKLLEWNKMLGELEFHYNS